MAEKEATLDDFKLCCELMGHSSDVRAVCGAMGGGSDGGEASIGGGQSLISGSRDKTAKLWRSDGAEYVEARSFQDHKNFVSSVCYLEREGWICTGSNDATICVYKEDSYVPILTLRGHEETVSSLAPGLKEQSLISGSWDKTARVWEIDPLGGMSSIVLRGHEMTVWCVASISEKRQYITGSADKTIAYWSEKGEKLRVLVGHTDCVRGVLSLGPELLVSCANDAVIRCWNEEGECVRQLSGHTNYIYSLALNQNLGEHVVVSCGEDSTVRMWCVRSGRSLGALLMPAQSVWAVACLRNGDILAGCSDGVIRIFSRDPRRQANEVVLTAFEMVLETRRQQMEEQLGGMKKTDLPGPESLLLDGDKEGAKKIVRFPDGSVKCYLWQGGTWTLVGDVTGAVGGTQESSGKTLHEGKEYDFVFNVDISESQPPLKLPYNLSQDPWHVAQVFIHKHNLPQTYLDQVANFIIKNSSHMPRQTEPSTNTYQDPFTGGSRYMPGSSGSQFQSLGNVDPFTGGSSYSTNASHVPSKVDVQFTNGGDKHFPVSKYASFDNCDPKKILDKLKDFNQNLESGASKVSEAMLEAVILLAKPEPDVDSTLIEALNLLLHWPNEILFPVLDVARLAIRNETIFSMMNSMELSNKLLPLLATSAPNQLMTVRCLVNMMCHESGRKEVIKRLHPILEQVIEIKTGSANLQVAIATFYLNITISEIVGVAKRDTCHIVTEAIVELLKWATDLEACYRSIQAIGNLTCTPFGAETSAVVISVDYVMDKIRELTNKPQPGIHAKLNSAGNALLAAF